MNLKLEGLTPDSFAPFGKVIQQPLRPHDAGGPGWEWWGENLLMDGGERNYAIGYLNLTPAPLCFDWAECHMFSDELVIPLGDGCIIYAAPADTLQKPDHLPPFESFRAFHICPGQGVIFGKGVWHGAPLALDHPVRVLVLLQAGTGAQDVHIVRFPERSVTIER